MSKANDFIIENGVLKKYTGTDAVVTVPDGVTSIGEEAFYYCENLTSVTIPDSVTSIGGSAFEGCSSLTSVTIPDSVTGIGEWAFSYCSNLTSVTIPASVTSIGRNAFSGCRSLTSVTIPDSVTNIGDRAFENCRSLTSVTIPDSVTNIGERAFENCTSLTGVTIPDSVTNIGGGAFYGCSSLTGVYITDLAAWCRVDFNGYYSNPLSYTHNLYVNGELVTELVIPDGVTGIGGRAFFGCSSLTSVTIPDSVTSIGELAFFWCVRLTSVTIPGSVTSIGGRAFENCSSLTSVTIPASVTSIGEGAFEGCSSLTGVYITDLAAWCRVDFKGGGLNPLEEAHDLYINGELVTELVIPDGVTGIGNDTFSGFSRLTSVTIPASVTSIGGSAFAYCSSLTSVTIPASVTSIGERAFADCSSLTNVTIPGSVTSIGGRAFADCSSLTSVTIPASVKRMGKYIFSGCVGISELVLPEKNKLPLFEKIIGAKKNSLKAPDGFDASLIDAALSSSVGYLLAYGFCRVEKKDYKKAALDSYVKNAAADAVAASADHTALMALLSDWAKNEGPRWYAPYAAFANEEELAGMIAKMKEWEKDKTKKEQLIRVRGAILLNDTVAAMRYADSLGLLDRYAEMRGLDADALRDETISDFGLDPAGRRTWTLAGKTLTAILNNDLTFTLTDETGKILKSVPKKGADATEYETVKKEFAALKKDVKATAKTRNDKILADFLSGKARPADAWKNAYLKNPVLRALARLIVWAQGNNTFILNEHGGPVTADGGAYIITGKKIKVAHPMEMNTADVDAWQRYFTEKGLKQPFEQIWEPVADAALIKPGRYDGCTVPLYTLMNKEKHGITMEGQSRITLKGCSADLIYIEGHHDWVNNEFEVKNFKFEKYTRQVNHIVVHLDKATVTGRVKKDDVTAAQWFDHFTLAQIQGFIDLANENKATNVLALLLEYKEKTFPDFDPMDEFTLEW